MPLPATTVIATTPPSTITIALEPAINVFNSMMMLAFADEQDTTELWVSQAQAAMGPGRLQTHRLFMLGLFYALQPYRSYASFPAYLDELAATNPTVLRDRLFDKYDEMAFCPQRPHPDVAPPTYTRADLLANPDTYLAFLRDRFREELIDEDLERRTHALLNDLPALHERVLSHLRSLWYELLADEWVRVVPTLQTCVAACMQIDISQVDTFDAVQKVVGQALDEKWREPVENAARIVLVPSAHVGGHLVQYEFEDTLWLIFRAHLPEGVRLYAPELARSDLLVRLQSVADDTRLRILRYVAEQGEMCSQDVMTALDLSQSATSRHLKQLSAAGFLRERRRESAKCYRLEPDAFQTLCQALDRYLQV